MKQRTLKNAISFDGFSVPGDDLSVVTLRPAAPDSGITFLVDNVFIPATAKFLDERFIKWTSLTSEGVTVHNVEHLLSALYGLGITNLVVDVETGTGIPVMDGSATGIVNTISRAGVVGQGVEQYARTVSPKMVSEQATDFRTGTVVGRRPFIMSFPYPSLRIVYILNYAGTPLGHQLVDLEINPHSYPSLIAPARTFMTTWEIDRWRGTLLGDKFCDMVPKLSGTTMFKERFAGEAATHKVLDMIGDLALLGTPVKGLFVGMCSGHSLNKKLVKELW